MVEIIVDKMNKLIDELKESILLDIQDIQTSNQEELDARNDKKFDIIENILSLKKELDIEFTKKIQEGFDINLYKTKIDRLEENLYELNGLNRKLAAIVEPIKEIYTNLVKDITDKFGGSVFDIKA